MMEKKQVGKKKSREHAKANTKTLVDSPTNFHSSQKDLGHADQSQSTIVDLNSNTCDHLRYD